MTSYEMNQDLKPNRSSKRILNEIFVGGKKRSKSIISIRTNTCQILHLSRYLWPLHYQNTFLVSTTITMLLRSSLAKSLSLRRVVAATSPVNSTISKTRLLSTVKNTFPTPILFDYETIKNNLTVSDAISSVEEAFGALADGKVDVPMPMHIGIEESEVAGPGDCHIKVSRNRLGGDVRGC